MFEQMIINICSPRSSKWSVFTHESYWETDQRVQLKVPPLLMIKQQKNSELVEIKAKGLRSILTARQVTQWGNPGEFIDIIMVNIACESNGHCPYQYYCDPNNHCIHDPVFPLTLYPILIYCLFPFASAICNTSGNSFGEFKVIFLMDLLDYTESAATVLTYPLTVGTALFNFITLLFRRHPSKDTSAVDFNIVMIIIPSVLYGSTIGALVNKFIPPIVADVLIIFILAGFSVKFFLRFYNFRKQELLQRQQELAKLTREIQITQVQADIEKQTKKKALQRTLLDQKSISQDAKEKNSILQNQNQKEETVAIRSNAYQKQLQQQLQYESTYHAPHILATWVIFGIFETLSFLAQGKIIIFSICSDDYAIGMSCLTVVFFAFIIYMYFFTKKKVEFYRKIQYAYQYKLDSPKFYVLVVMASFLGGFNGGVFGVGSSTTMIFCLLYLQIQPIVVSATVGYQVIFGGLGSLFEAFATDEITIEVAGFFLGITFVLGGILSFIAMKFVRKLNKNRTNQVIMIIVGSLTGASTLALIVNIILSYDQFGAAYMISSPFQC